MSSVDRLIETEDKMVEDAVKRERARNQAEIDRLRDALQGIQRYGLDTLSGRTDGPDDKDWQRAGVNEMTKRARLALEGASGVATVAPADEWKNEAATVLAQFIHLSVTPDRDEWAKNASRAIGLLNDPAGVLACAKCGGTGKLQWLGGNATPCPCKTDAGVATPEKDQS